MTHFTQFSGCHEAIQLLAEHGFEGLAKVIELLLNEVMKIERCEVLGAAPYQRTEQRRGHANGYKEKTVHSRIGDLHLDVPQTRNVDFYPQALERGIRSERALTAALAEMYVQGVSTRKVTKIVHELCGHEVSSSQLLSRARRFCPRADSLRFAFVTGDPAHATAVRCGLSGSGCAPCPRDLRTR